eukprot:tig00021501_g21960.t1
MTGFIGIAVKPSTLTIARTSSADLRAPAAGTCPAHAAGAQRTGSASEGRGKRSVQLESKFLGRRFEPRAPSAEFRLARQQASCSLPTDESPNSHLPPLKPEDIGLPGDVEVLAGAAKWYFKNLQNEREVGEDEMTGEAMAKCCFCQSADRVPKEKMSNPFQGKAQAWEEGYYLTPAAEEMIFYLLSRGVGLDDAENLAMSRVCKSVLEEIPVNLASRAGDLLSIQGSMAIYGNADVSVFLDPRPICKGHLLVIPTDHCTSLENFSHDVAGPVFYVASQIGAAMAKVVDSDTCQVLVQTQVHPDYPCEVLDLEGQNMVDAAIPHVHFHVLPKYEGLPIWETINMENARQSELDPKQAQTLYRAIQRELAKMGVRDGAPTA